MTGILDDKVALVTGAAGGLGRAITAGLLGAGARVLATDVSDAGLKALAAGHGAATASGALRTLRLDIADAGACAAAVATAEHQFDGLDILINNGALGMGAIRDDHMTNLVRIEEISPEVWDQFVRVNLSGAWYLTRAAVPALRRRGGGRIVNVTTSFFTMLRGRFHPYGPSKAALEAMSAGHAQEFEPDGITVNVVVPGGPADTSMVPAISGYDRAALVPPAAMVPPIVWLCSLAASGVTGRRYIAADWKADATLEENRRTAEAPIGWPGLAGTPVWPGGKPKA